MNSTCDMNNKQHPLKITIYDMIINVNIYINIKVCQQQGVNTLSYQVGITILFIYIDAILMIIG
eukprot:gnl/Chilomastix_caulleri/8686.p1 GENE.gnl/Chilomastix_caulleri/8686~~gnl/Chilomastix_caulleri/8686.p1  ORF type:complete len:64 (+),score=5.16 gnl/Chilomastix_caulleri/8686:121-312(+)